MGWDLTAREELSVGGCDVIHGGAQSSVDICTEIEAHGGIQAVRGGCEGVVEGQTHELRGVAPRNDA